jgi:hypothetical protein
LRANRAQIVLLSTWNFQGPHKLLVPVMKAQATYEIKQLKPHRFFVPKITLGFQNLAMNNKAM